MAERLRPALPPFDGVRTAKASKLLRRRQVRYPWQLRGNFVRRKPGSLAAEQHIEIIPADQADT